MLLAAFEKDPWMNYFFPANYTTKNESILWSFSKILEYGVKHGRVYGSYKDNELQGVAIWQPPYEAGMFLIIIF